MSNVLYRCLKSRDATFQYDHLYTIEEISHFKNNPKTLFLEPHVTHFDKTEILEYNHVFRKSVLDGRYMIHSGMTPVHSDMYVEVVQRNGTRKQEYAKNIPWSSKVNGKDVVAYRIISIPNPMAINERLKNLEEENKELRKALEEYEEYERYEKQNQFPQLGDKFYYIDFAGRVKPATWGNLAGNEYDLQKFTGVYETREEAELVAEAIREFVKEHNE